MAQQRNTAGRKGPGTVTAAKTGSKRGFYLLIAAAAIAGIVALGYLSGRTKGAAPIALDPTLPPVTSQGYVMGSPTAPLEVIEFGDFECIVCSQFYSFAEGDVRAQYINTGKIRWRFIDYPIVSVHRNTLNGSVAAACADEQGKFWPMHDILYEKQDEWNGAATNDPDKELKRLARQIAGIDGAKFDSCVDTRRTLPKVQAHMAIASARQIGGTPTFIIGSKQGNYMSFDAFKKLVDEALAAVDTTKRAGAAKTTGKAPKKP